MIYKGIKITEELVGKKVRVTSIGDYHSDDSYIEVGKQYTIDMVDVDNSSEFLLVDTDDGGWYIDNGCGQDFEWVNVKPIIKTTKTQRKTLAKAIRFQIEKLNTHLNQLEEYGMEINIGSLDLDGIEITYQPSTPPLQEY